LGGVMRSALGGAGGASPKSLLIQAVLQMLLQRGLGGQQGGGLGGLGSILGGLTGGPQAQGGGLGGLGGILGGLTGGGPGAGGGMGGLGGLGGALGGGLGGLGQLFEQAGMGSHMNSWVSTGQNMPISPDQLSRVFGADGLSQIAEAAGMSQKDAADQLSQILPNLVDGLTPQGGVPQGDEVSQDALGALVGRVLAGGR
ncbi:MAG TPA: YidB family protein, partial [Vineibacter sp.]|nr:YidB family protein [Vineibacter sp.]